MQGLHPLPTVLPTYLPWNLWAARTSGQRAGWWCSPNLGEIAVRASCLLQGINWHCHSIGGAPGSSALPTPISFNFLLPGFLTFTSPGTFVFISLCPELDIGTQG